MDVWISPEDAGLLKGKSLSIGSHGYVQLTHDGQMKLLHRLLLGLRKGDRRIGDHENGDERDYRRHNLRIVNPSESSSNKRGFGRSGYRGVYQLPSGRFSAGAKLHNVTYRLGTYDTAEEASEVSRAWRREHMPGYVDR